MVIIFWIILGLGSSFFIGTVATNLLVMSHDMSHEYFSYPGGQNLKSSLLVAKFTISGNYLKNSPNTLIAHGLILQYVQ